MTLPHPANLKLWRCTFIAMEIALVVSGVGLRIIKAQAEPRMHTPGALEDTLGVVYGATMLMLLLGSPWLIKSLRSIALVGWGFGIVAFLIPWPL